ncbi:MAG: SIMPL domain-containing protein, partial [Longimicrobiales bacterium]
LRETDLPGLEIETRGYSLQPRYRRPDAGGTREIDGFTARNMIEVTVDDPASAGALVDAGIGAGANRVASLTFLASDTEEARLRALRDAVATAHREAEAMAGALGMSLGEPLEVTGGADRSPPTPMPFRMESATFQDASTPVEPGTRAVSASVTIRYTLRGGQP